MTSTPSILLLKRSGLSSDRPSGVVVQGGELAISRGAVDPGLYFEDTAGSIRKIGPAHYGTTAPNSTPAGIPGNSVGELWTDSSSPNSYLNVWTGSAWVKIGAGYADTAGFASQANTALIASGAITADFATQASTAILASGAIFASGSFSSTSSSTSILSLGSLLSSGTVIATGIPVAAIDAALPVSAQQGTLFYQTAAPSGLYIYTAAGWAQV
jgi:hypothetical protein